MFDLGLHTVNILFCKILLLFFFCYFEIKISLGKYLFGLDITQFFKLGSGLGYGSVELCLCLFGLCEFFFCAVLI